MKKCKLFSLTAKFIPGKRDLLKRCSVAGQPVQHRVALRRHGRLQRLYQFLYHGSGHEERIGFLIYAIVRDATAAQIDYWRAIKELWHLAGKPGEPPHPLPLMIASENQDN